MTNWVEDVQENEGIREDNSDDLTILQGDMVTLRHREQVLHGEICVVNDQYDNVTQMYSMESELSLQDTHSDIDTPKTPPRLLPSRPRRTAGNLSYTNRLLEQLIDMTSSLEETEISDGSPCQVKFTSVVMDTNSNYMSPDKCNIKGSFYSTLPEESSSSSSSSLSSLSLPEYSVDFPETSESFAPRAPNVTRQSMQNLELLGSSSSRLSSSIQNTTSSDGYPKSMTTTTEDSFGSHRRDIDSYEQDRISRMKYYSDFTIDRRQQNQRQANNTSQRPKCLSLLERGEPVGAENEPIRHVEGAETRLCPVRRILFSVPPSPSLSDGSGSNLTTPQKTVLSHHSSQSSAHCSKSSNSNHSNSSNSHPLASSTMITDNSVSHSPKATGGENVWSVQESVDKLAKQSNVHTVQPNDLRDLVCVRSPYKQQAVKKPQVTPDGKNYIHRKVTSHKKTRHLQCRDHDVHLILNEPCSLQFIETMSDIEHNSTCREEYYSYEQSTLCEEETSVKYNTLPRTSTKLNILDVPYESSSIEARRASMPDLTNLSSPDVDFQSDISSSSSAEENLSPLLDRLELPGESQTSCSMDSTNSTDPSRRPSLYKQRQNNKNNDAELLDSILTDSPESVKSSGIFAPFNSYNSPGDTDHGSTANHSPVIKIRNNKPKTTHILLNIPVLPPSPKLNNISPNIKNVTKDDLVFKKPQGRPMRRLFRSRRSLSRASEAMTSTPKVGSTPTLPQSSKTSSSRSLFTSHSSGTSDMRLLNKKSVIKKLKQFSDSFYKRDRSGRTELKHLANL